MTTLLDCMHEVIALGPGYFIRTDSAGTYRPSEWEATALLADIERECPRVLDDPAWTEWAAQRDGSRTCAINYGRSGRGLEHQELPGYGHLRVCEVSQRRPQDLDLLRILRPPENRYLRQHS
jgi:hypothetical protein